VAEPFMPGFTDKVVHVLGLPHAAIPDTFLPTALIPTGTVLTGKPGPLFSAISEEQVAHFRETFGGSQADAAEAAALTTVTAAGAPAPADKKVKTGKGGAAKGKEVDISGLPDAARVDLRVGVITRVWPHPTLSQLWCEEIDVGEGAPRLVASGLRAFYTQEGMLGRRVAVVCNLKPRTMGGPASPFESAGMVLCASNADRTVVEFIEPPVGAVPGERLTLEGVIPPGAPFPVPEVLNPSKKGCPWLTVAPGLRTDGGRVATFNGVPLMTSAGPVTAPTQADAPIG